MPPSPAPQDRDDVAPSPAEENASPNSEVRFRVTASAEEVSSPEGAFDSRSEARHVLELPLRLLLVSDFVPSGSSSLARPRRVDKHSFAELLEEAAPSLTLHIPDHLGAAAAGASPRDRTRSVSLTFEALGDFAPMAVARQIPALRHLLQVRSLVEDAQRGAIDCRTFKEQVQALDVREEWAERLFSLLTSEADSSQVCSSPSPAEPTADSRPKDIADDSGPLDRILDLVDAGTVPDDGLGEAPSDAAGGAQATRGRGPSTTSPKTLVGYLARAVTADVKPPPLDATGAGALIDEIDALVQQQLKAVFTHEAFRKLEACWRELKFLVDRLDFRAGIELEVMAAPRDALGEVLHDHVLLPEHEASRPGSASNDRPPLSAIVLGHRFGHERHDIALLRDLAETGASLQAPVIASAAPSFFGQDTPGALEALPPLHQHLQKPEYLHWRKLRASEAASFLALAVPPFVLRAAHGNTRGGSASARVPVEEEPLWGGAALLVAAAAAASHARTGWATHLAESSTPPVKDLPLWQPPSRTTGVPSRRAQTSARLPLAVSLPQAKQAELAEAGFLTLSATPNRDTARVAAPAPVIRDTSGRASHRARTHATLPCQFFVARAAHFLIVYKRHLARQLRPSADSSPSRNLPPTVTLEDMQADVDQHLRAFLRSGGRAERLAEGTKGLSAPEALPEDAVSVNPARSEALQENQLVLAIRLRPPGFALAAQVSLVMGLDLPRSVLTNGNDTLQGGDGPS